LSYVRQSESSIEADAVDLQQLLDRDIGEICARSIAMIRESRGESIANKVN
jgi:hypothetical protein